MLIDRNKLDNTATIYPNGKKGKAFDRLKEPRIVISKGLSNVSMVVTREDAQGNHPMVLFSGINKTELQDMVNVLQSICYELEGDITDDVVTRAMKDNKDIERRINLEQQPSYNWGTTSTPIPSSTSTSSLIKTNTAFEG